MLNYIELHEGIEGVLDDHIRSLKKWTWIKMRD